MGELRDALEGQPFALVVNASGIVLGKVLSRSVEAATDPEPARRHLIEGPTTVRADEDVDALLERMRRADTGSVIVTTPEGRLLGVFFRDEVAGNGDEALRASG